MAVTSKTSTAPAALANAAEFVAIGMPPHPKPAARAAAEPNVAAPVADSLIQIELRRGPLHLSVRWPSAAAQDCRAWLSELSSCLLK